MDFFFKIHLQSLIHLFTEHLLLLGSRCGIIWHSKVWTCSSERRCKKEFPRRLRRDRQTPRKLRRDRQNIFFPWKLWKVNLETQMWDSHTWPWAVKTESISVDLCKKRGRWEYRRRQWLSLWSDVNLERTDTKILGRLSVRVNYIKAEVSPEPRLCVAWGLGAVVSSQWDGERERTHGPEPEDGYLWVTAEWMGRGKSPWAGK